MLKWLENKILGKDEDLGLTATKAYADQLLRVSFSLIVVSMMSLATIIAYYMFSSATKFILSAIIDVRIAWVAFLLTASLSFLANRLAIRFYNKYDRKLQEKDQ